MQRVAGGTDLFEPGSGSRLQIIAESGWRGERHRLITLTSPAVALTHHVPLWLGGIIDDELQPFEGPLLSHIRVVLHCGLRGVARVIGQGKIHGRADSRRIGKGGIDHPQIQTQFPHVPVCHSLVHTWTW